ncbi:MAG: DNA translocase FtsK 4TM domain-containing protein, partial [Acidimicrobiia bacterium]|nr:DNA translocase FtsK 4TM domain-containing protein [Acidimicrobiia bacterium]
MATTRARKRPPASKSRSAKSKPPAKRRTKAGPPVKRRASKAAKPPKTARVRAAARTQMEGHGSDALAIGLLVLGLLSGLALATNLTGPLGSAFGDGLRALFGHGGFLIPIALVATAGLLLWRRPEDAEAAAPLRVGFGVGLVLVGVAGLVHVLGGTPSLSGPVDGLRDAGGYFGAIVGAPLAAALGVVGAVVVLVAVTIFGLLVAPGISIREVLGMLRRGFARLGALALVALDAAGLRDGEPMTDENIEAEAEARSDRRPMPSRRTTIESITGDAPPEAFDAEPEPLAAEVVELDDVDLADDDDEEDVPLAASVAASGVDPADIQVREDAKGQIAIDLTQYGHGDWTLPPRDLLKRSQVKALDKTAVEQGGQVLQATLKDFGVDANLIGMTVGPTVTRYELELAP